MDCRYWKELPSDYDKKWRVENYQEKIFTHMPQRNIWTHQLYKQN